MAALPASQMNLRYKRNEINVVGANKRGCLRVMPMGKKSRQKIVVGDQTGVVTMFGLGKHHDCKVDFTTPKAAKPVSAVDLFEDQVFAAVGERVNAFTRKGKPFFALDTTLSEPINHLRISTPFIFIGGEYVQTNFREAEELGFLMAPDKINSMLISPPTTDGCDVFLACHDRTVRSARKTALLKQADCDSPVNSLQWHRGPQAPVIICGTLGGSIGGFEVDADAAFTRKFVAAPATHHSAVTALSVADFTQDGLADVAVGRDDGGVELHSFELNPDGVPVKAWRGELNEFVTSLEHGFITTTEREEMCVCTYSGKVVSFAPHAGDPTVPQALSGAQQPLPMSVQQQAPVAMRDGAPVDESVSVARAKMSETQHEIKQLEETLQKRKTEYAQMLGETATPGAAVKAIAATFSVRDKLFLSEDGVVTMSVELDTNMESVSVATELDLELIDQSGGDILVCVTNRELVRSNFKVLALYRTTTSCTRLETRFRPHEGQSGDVDLIVTARGNPKTAQKVVFYLPPLCLHRRLQDEQAAIQASLSDPTLSTLTIRGGFTGKQIHSWLYKCFFDVSEILTRNDWPIRVAYEHAYVGTVLVLEYEEGSVSCRSQNISSLVLVKNFITRQATESKVQLQIDISVQPPSVARMLELLHPKLDHLASLARSVSLLEALREIEQQEPEVDTFLNDDFKHTLKHGKVIEAEFADHPKKLAFVERVLVTLLTDVATSIGQAVAPQQVERLRAIVANYDQRHLVDFFNQL